LRKYVPSADLTSALERTLAQPLSGYDLAVDRYLNPICKLVLAPELPVVVDLDDLGYRYGIPGRGVQAAIDRLKSAVAGLLFRRQLHRFDAFAFVSQRDRDRYPGLLGCVVPNIPYSFDPAPDFAVTGNTLLFVGSLWYRPNREGVQWFLDDVWPRIRAAVPGVRFVLVGAAPKDQLEAWRQVPGVQALGFVDDLAHAYRNAALTVSPIHSGGGTNIKVLEALAYGRACVTTRFCIAGFADLLREGDGLIAADDAASFAICCIAALSDRARTARIAQDGHRRVLVQFSDQRFLEAVDRVLNLVVGH
jgi:glycosyltransferase involved in cell wall biosynthesis